MAAATADSYATQLNRNRPGHHSQAQHQQDQQPTSHLLVKAVTGVTAGGSLLVLSGLILVGTVICLTLATPLLVIFSPVLVPAAITVFLVVAGFVASGGFGVAAIGVITWMYKYLTGKNPPGSEQMEMSREKLAAKAKELKEKADQSKADNPNA